MPSSATTLGQIKALLAGEDSGGWQSPSSSATPQTSAVYSFIIAAGAEINVLVPGTAFYLYSCPAMLNVRPRGGQYNPYTQGTGLFLRPNEAFPSVDVQNKNAQAIAFSIFVGWGSFIDNRLILSGSAVPVIDRISDLLSSAGSASPVTLASMASVVFLGAVPSSLYISRKSFQVTNLDSSNSLYVLGSDGNLASVVLPLTEKIYFTSSKLSLVNPNGAGVLCTYGETWNYA